MNPGYVVLGRTKMYCSSKVSIRVIWGTNSLRLEHLGLYSKWNIVKKNGVKHHSSNPIYMYKMYISSQAIYCSITVLVLISIFASFVLCHNCYHCTWYPFLFPYCPYTTEIKYKITQSTSFMLCMSYRYINKTSPLFCPTL